MIMVNDIEGFNELNQTDKEAIITIGDGLYQQNFKESEIIDILKDQIKAFLTKAKYKSPDIVNVANPKSFLLYSIDLDGSLSDQERAGMKKVIENCTLEELENMIKNHDTSILKNVCERVYPKPMKAIATTPDNRNNILRTPYGDIPTMTIGKGYYKQLYDDVDESPIPKTKKEINIRRESLISIFENRAELLLNTFIDTQMNLFNKKIKLPPDYYGDLGFAVHTDTAINEMKFLKSLDFYFQYNLTDSMLCDLTNQACSYMYNQLIKNLNYNPSKISSNEILQIVNYYGQLFWGVLIQLNREAHDYYYSMGIPDFQEPKKLD